MTPASTSDVAIVTAWYPTAQRPFLGAFVQAMVEATAPGCDRVTVYHCDEWGYRPTPEQERAVTQAHHQLLPHTLRPVPTAGGAALLNLPVLLPIGLPHAEVARRHEATLRAALRGEKLSASVVHAHVGLPSAWAALQNTHPDTPVFVTEHATYLDTLLAQPESRAMYEEVLRRCAGFFAVGRAVRDPLVAAFPQHADRIKFIPNPVSFATTRPTPVTELRRWLYVGGLIPRKGVRRLLSAFATCRSEDPTLSLTLVGDGKLRGELADLAAELGVAEAVRFTGPLPPAEALRLMREHDLLVHASQFETFGMTVVEASAAGMPVLVTRCGGPEEILAGIEESAGELVEVSEDAESLAEGYRRLRARFAAGMDLSPARRTLAGRYGYEAVAEAHHNVWFPAPAPAVPAEPNPERAVR
ncbi:glycosyltransferase [Micromonospora eburnea]|uniref:Glycogen(Starch) synthase n=1 Tax=Micromonospora eburnea TaxID=227316 RepID=A0A1C6U3X7_9ACTN|nr:glycosyltransferase [Micromonospora eburnea]SCL48623.1 glycogen(starch) synthase [Micromonospora eburnea]